MKAYILTSLLILNSALLFGQEKNVTLEECRQAARKNYPLAKQQELLKSSADNQLKNSNTAYLPQLEMNAQGTYQSDVPGLPIKIPNMEIPELDKDRYQATLDARQLLYDGGAVSSQRQLIKNSTEIEQQKVDVELFKTEEKVIQLYFSALLAEASEKQLQLFKTELEAKQKKLESGVKNGVTLPSNLYILQAELMKIEQRLLENNIGRASAVKSLGLITGLNLDTSTILQTPGVQQINLTNDFTARPEFRLYILMQKNALVQQTAINVKNRPKIFAFGQAGYGKPGLDLFNNEFKPFYIIGLKANWNLSNFYTAGREKEIQKINSDIVENQKSAFTKNMEIALAQQQSEIEKLEASIKMDDQLIELSKKISASAASQLENGIITASDFLTERNRQYQAELSKELHLLQLNLAKINYLILTGK